MKKRTGNMARRELEFRVVMDQVKRRKGAFMARIQRWARQEGDCLLWVGAHDGCGYGVMSFRYEGRHIKINVPRVMLILKLGAPIPKSVEAGHSEGCANRACIKHIEAQHWKYNNAERDRRNGWGKGNDEQDQQQPIPI